ncbi:MAG: DUF4315 family protein, partial [Clostridia bacterium]
HLDMKGITMNSKLEKYTEERDKIVAKMSVLDERRKVLDGKIMEAENLEIRAMMRSENLSLPELMELMRSMQEQHRAPYAVICNDDTTEEKIEEEPTDEEA